MRVPLAQAAKNNLHLADQPRGFTIAIRWKKDTFLKRTTIKIESDVHKIKIEITNNIIFKCTCSYFIFIATKMNESSNRCEAILFSINFYLRLQLKQ